LGSGEGGCPNASAPPKNNADHMDFSRVLGIARIAARLQPGRTIQRQLVHAGQRIPTTAIDCVINRLCRIVMI